MDTASWITPHGRTVTLAYRPDTNDWNVCQSVIAEDEYKLPHPLSGTALDIGAHIGACSVALLEDNPDLRVVAVEPIPENLELLRRNLAPYGERAIVMDGAAGKGKVTIHYGYAGKEEFGVVHRFIGNQYFGDEQRPESREVNGVTLSALVKQYGPIAFLKIDCEGCEHDFLDDDAIDKVERMAGEYHAGPKVELRFDKPARDPGEKPANRRKRVVRKATK